MQSTGMFLYPKPGATMDEPYCYDHRILSALECNFVRYEMQAIAGGVEPRCARYSAESISPDTRHV
jgi:hypothetical protein